ncbi:hypothetical protein [Novosphingobium sp. BL-52-GroH]|uniref:hypothetical protein n=1 Tax=Novosphingobium sp. BL-52-GroH TaxID=3349877 RepID=UPI00384A4CBB
MPVDGKNYYLTINDYVHADGRRVPFEIFISTSLVENFETMAALTRTLSAACRRGDATFLFEEAVTAHGETCPSCNRDTAHRIEVCLTCFQCGYSKCG